MPPSSTRLPTKAVSAETWIAARLPDCNPISESAALRNRSASFVPAIPSSRSIWPASDRTAYSTSPAVRNDSPTPKPNCARVGRSSSASTRAACRKRKPRALEPASPKIPPVASRRLTVCACRPTTRDRSVKSELRDAPSDPARSSISSAARLVPAPAKTRSPKPLLPASRKRLRLAASPVAAAIVSVPRPAVDSMPVSRPDSKTSSATAAMPSMICWVIDRSPGVEMPRRSTEKAVVPSVPSDATPSRKTTLFGLGTVSGSGFVPPGDGGSRRPPKSTTELLPASPGPSGPALLLKPTASSTVRTPSLDSSNKSMPSLPITALPKAPVRSSSPAAVAVPWVIVRSLSC